jgi:hypothetical protein
VVNTKLHDFFGRYIMEFEQTPKIMHFGKFQLPNLGSIAKFEFTKNASLVNSKIQSLLL